MHVALRRLLGVGLAAALIALPAMSANAAVVLNDLDTTVTIDPNSSAAVSSWNVEGIEHLNVMGYWYRVGAADEQSIDSLTLVSAVATDESLKLPAFLPEAPLVNDYDNDTLRLTYQDSLTNPTFEITIEYGVTGGLVNGFLDFSSVQEVVAVNNLSDQAIDFHLFGYQDFDLLDSALDTHVWAEGAERIHQRDGALGVEESVVPGGADSQSFEVGVVPSIVSRLSGDGIATDLLNVSGPLFSENLAFAFQWDKVLAPEGEIGSSLLFSTNKQIAGELSLPPEVPDVPVSPGAGLVLLGVAGLMKSRRLRR